MPFPDGVPLLCLDGSGFPCSAGPTETPCGSYRAAPLHEAMYPAGLGGGGGNGKGKGLASDCFCFCLHLLALRCLYVFLDAVYRRMQRLVLLWYVFRLSGYFRHYLLRLNKIFNCHAKICRAVKVLPDTVIQSRLYGAAPFLGFQDGQDGTHLVCGIAGLFFLDAVEKVCSAFPAAKLF